MRARPFILGVLGFWFPALMLAGIALMVAGGTPRIPGAIGNHISAYWLFDGILVFILGWVAYLWDLFHNPRVPREKRARWAVVLLFVGPYAMPFYFWFYIRESAPRSSPPPQAVQGPPS